MTLGDRCIIARNENEIKELQELKARVIRNTDEAIKGLRNQNREIKGRS